MNWLNYINLANKYLNSNHYLSIIYYLLSIKISQSFDKNGKSKLTDPWPDYKIPFTLLAYDFFKNIYIFYYNFFNTFSSTFKLIELTFEPSL
jgi:hypothetical protein